MFWRMIVFQHVIYYNSKSIFYGWWELNPLSESHIFAICHCCEHMNLNKSNYTQHTQSTLTISCIIVCKKTILYINNNGIVHIIRFINFELFLNIVCCTRVLKSNVVHCIIYCFRSGLYWIRMHNRTASNIFESNFSEFGYLLGLLMLELFSSFSLFRVSICYLFNLILFRIICMFIIMLLKI